MELGMTLIIVLSILSYAIPVFVAIKMIKAIIEVMKQQDGKKRTTKINLDDKPSIRLGFSEMEDSNHEGCRTVGNILHPEKTGILKDGENPFEC